MKLATAVGFGAAAVVAARADGEGAGGSWRGGAHPVCGLKVRLMVVFLLIKLYEAFEDVDIARLCRMEKTELWVRRHVEGLMELSKMVGFCRRVVGPIGVVRPVPGLAPSVSFRLLARLLARLPLYRTIFVVLSRAGSVLVWLAVAPQLWLWPQAFLALYSWRLLVIVGDAAKGASARVCDGVTGVRVYGTVRPSMIDIFAAGCRTTKALLHACG